MSYVNINTLEKVEAIDIMRENPEVSFPNRAWFDEELAPYGYAELWLPSEYPTPSTYEKLVEVTPKKVDSKWYAQFDVAPMTEEEIKFKNDILENNFIREAQAWLDLFASTRGYDGILSLTTYATSSNSKFQIEGQYGVQLRDETWASVYKILDEVKSGTRSMPVSFDSVLSEMPTPGWPGP